MKLIVMGGSGSEPVTADDLRMVVTYCNQLRQIEDMLAAHAESIITRLPNGAELEISGHDADVKGFSAGSVKHQVLSIDGVERYRRVSGGVRQVSQAVGA